MRAGLYEQPSSGPDFLKSQTVSSSLVFWCQKSQTTPATGISVSLLTRLWWILLEPGFFWGARKTAKKIHPRAGFFGRVTVGKSRFFVKTTGQDRLLARTQNVLHFFYSRNFSQTVMVFSAFSRDPKMSFTPQAYPGVPFLDAQNRAKNCQKEPSANSISLLGRIIHRKSRQKHSHPRYNMTFPGAIKISGKIAIFADIYLKISAGSDGKRPGL